MLVRDSVESFLQARAATKKASTVAHYRGRLAAFVRVCGARDSLALTELECRRQLDQASRFADGRPKAPDTIRANVISFDQWQKFAVKAGHLPKLLVTEFEKPGSRERDRIPTDEENATVLRLAKPDFSLMFRALRLCGARPGELCKATIADIDRAEGVISLADHKTAGKTKKPRRIAIGHALEQLLAEAIGTREIGPIFLTARGKAWTVPALGQVFRRIRKKGGLPKDLVLYLARHEFASRLVDADVDIHGVAQSLGHSGLQTVKRYVKVKSQKLRDWQNRLEDQKRQPPPDPDGPQKAA